MAPFSVEKYVVPGWWNLVGSGPEDDGLVSVGPRVDPQVGRPPAPVSGLVSFLT